MWLKPEAYEEWGGKEIIKQIKPKAIDLPTGLLNR